VVSGQQSLSKAETIVLDKNAEIRIVRLERICKRQLRFSFFALWSQQSQGHRLRLKARDDLSRVLLRTLVTTLRPYVNNHLATAIYLIQHSYLDNRRYPILYLMSILGSLMFKGKVLGFHAVFRETDRLLCQCTSVFNLMSEGKMMTPELQKNPWFEEEEDDLKIRSNSETRDME
jgi:hypothetical protein